MKIIISLFVGFLFLTGVFGTTQQHGDQSCAFTVQGEPAQATITGPDDIVPLVYAVEQPDSPIEILSADLQGMWLSISGEQYTVRNCQEYKVRNRSDRTIERFVIELGGAGAISSSALAPGQTIELQGCGGGGHGGAPGNHLKLLLSVNSADFGGCSYRPSLRIPRNLGINTPW